MTGIEVFANLVAAYGGTAKQKSRKAFGSLTIIMGTTAATMLIVGPAIRLHSNALDENVSVFTQTMNYLFPSWLSYTGTLIGVAVLLSAAASAAQGVQNLALGLHDRNYIHARIGLVNNYGVADFPVWLMGGIMTVCFLVFGTKEDTYLALYAAGVFVLLTMTGWAATKRLVRELKTQKSKLPLLILFGTTISALLTTLATVIIFEERFLNRCLAIFYYGTNFIRSLQPLPKKKPQDLVRFTRLFLPKIVNRNPFFITRLFQNLRV